MSFISGTLKDESCCKFMLKHDIKNYFQQFTKTLTICFQWNANYVNIFWFKQWNVCAKYGILSDKDIRFIG